MQRLPAAGPGSATAVRCESSVHVSSARVRGRPPAIRPGRSGEPVRIALCVPMSGPEGIWGPSCLASASLALDELNDGDGIAGRPCEVRVVNASDEAADLESTLLELVADGEVDALVGMHMSSVRQRIVRAVGGRVPYVYTCLYEGGETTPGLYAIGETAAGQLRPSIRWLSERTRRRRWALVGHDYVWPRVSHAIARHCIAECDGEVVAETLMPFAPSDYAPVLDGLRRSRADAVLITLVGQHAVEFNRAFGRAGLSGSVLRLSCAIEENQLLAIGGDSSEQLYVALGYFGSLESDANGAFKERYHSRFGTRAPTLNSMGQSLYEGLHFLAALYAPGRGAAGRRGDGPLAYRSARGSRQYSDDMNVAPMYLARAEGHLFRVIERF